MGGEERFRSPTPSLHQTFAEARDPNRGRRRGRPFAGSDKRVAVLCGSRKVEQPFPAEDGIGVLKTADDAVAIVTVLLQGNLARPSDLTRRAPRRRENSPPRRSA
jgi:hypothetical protein